MSIVGLESIYESNSSQRTLKERCEFFLARPKGNNSNVGDPIGELYKKRNTLVHGGMKISFKFGYDESFPEVENSWSTIYSLDAAIPFLVATLQKMAQLNIHKLEFELRLKKK